MGGGGVMEAQWRETGHEASVEGGRSGPERPGWVSLFPGRTPRHAVNLPMVNTWLTLSQPPQVCLGFCLLQHRGFQHRARGEGGVLGVRGKAAGCQESKRGIGPLASWSPH